MAGATSPLKQALRRTAVASLALLALPAPARASDPADGPRQLLRLDDGAQLVGRRAAPQLLWETGFGVLEISPERLLYTSRLTHAAAQGVTSPRPFRLRLEDGTLHVGWPATIDPSTGAVLLELEGGGSSSLTVQDVMEFNDLPRTGPATRLPVPRRAPAAAPSAEPAPPPPPPAPERKKKRWRRSMDPGARLAQVGLGYCGMALGAVVGGGGLALATDSGDAGLLGVALGVPLGATWAIHGVGEHNGGTEQLGPTLVGAAVGTLLSAALVSRGSPDAATALVPFLPVSGGMIGYLASEERDRD